MKNLYLKGYKWLLFWNKRIEMTFLVIDSTRHWPSISNLFLENIKVKGCQCPYYKNYSLFPDDLIAGSTTS